MRSSTPLNFPTESLQDRTRTKTIFGSETTKSVSVTFLVSGALCGPTSGGIHIRYCVVFVEHQVLLSLNMRCRHGASCVPTLLMCSKVSCLFSCRGSKIIAGKLSSIDNNAKLITTKGQEFLAIIKLHPSLEVNVAVW